MSHDPHDQRDIFAEMMASVEEMKVHRLTQTVRDSIETEEEYEQLLAQAERLMRKDENILTPEEDTLLDILFTRIEQYEDQHYPIDEEL